MISSKEVAKKVASELLQIKAIKLQPHNPFQWSSGWLSPIYCDNRLTLSYPTLRTYIKEQLSLLVTEKFSSANLISGVATAGIPQGALIAEQLELPYVYVRPEPKKHGMGNQIEGRVPAGSQVVIVEDLISTGGSSLKTVAPLKNEGCRVIGAVAIFDYGFQKAVDSFETASLPYFTLSNYDTLLEVALEAGQIQEEDIETLTTWRANPEEWKGVLS